jgi:hypothetical protein
MAQLHAMACFTKKVKIIANICVLFIVDGKCSLHFSVFHSLSIIGYMLKFKTIIFQFKQYFLRYNIFQFIGRWR